MRESEGKRIAREMLYRECLPAWLTPRELQEGNVLVLLGDEPREIPLLDGLGVPRGKIWSVEHDPLIYRAQLAQKLGVSLFCGEASEYLISLLHANQGFRVLNLDIEGSFLVNLDPAMTAVLLFCWRNPSTVVSTYTSIGRDTEMLHEGVLSLATLLYLAPEETRRALATLSVRYLNAGFTDPLRMVLRDLFWVRSHLEHAVRATGMIGETPLRSVKRLGIARAMIWDRIVGRGHKELTLSMLAAIVRNITGSAEFAREIPESVLPRVGLCLHEVRNVVYNAQRPWSHRCYFAKFSIPETLPNCRQWVSQVLNRMVAAPLTYINRQGERFDLETHLEGHAMPSDVLVWDDPGLYREFQPRTLEVLPHDRTLAHLNATVRQLQIAQSNPRSPKGDAGPNQGGEEVKTMKKSKRKTKSGRRKPNGQWTDPEGRLTKYGQAQLRKLAAKAAPDPKATTDAVLKLVPRRVRADVELHRGSITAYLAIARR